MNKCSSCNFEFDGNFCPECGTKVEEKVETVVENTAEEAEVQDTAKVEAEKVSEAVAEEKSTPAPEQKATENTSSDSKNSANVAEKKPEGSDGSSKFGRGVKKVFDTVMSFLGGKVMSNVLYALPYFAFILFNVLVWMFFSAPVQKFERMSLGSFYDYTFGNSAMDEPVVGFVFMYIFAILSTLVALFMAFMIAVPNLRKTPIKWFGGHVSLASILRNFSIFFYAIFMFFGIIISSYAKLGADGDYIRRGGCGPLFTVFSIIFLIHVGIALFASWYNKKYNDVTPSVASLFDDMNEPKVKEKKPKYAPVAPVYAPAPAVAPQASAQQSTPVAVAPVVAPVYSAPAPAQTPAQAPAQAIELEPVPELKIPKSKFTGGAFANFFTNLLVILVSGITFSLALPAMLCWKQRWMAKHTRYDEKSLRFDGKGIQLFGRYLLWLLLSVVTFGIFAIFVLPVSIQKWKTKHTHFSDTPVSQDPEQGPKSYFDGGALGYFGVNILTGLVIGITFGLGSFWAHCYKQRWLAKHTVIDGERLYFNGTGLQYFGKKIIWILLTVVTFGIYSFWLVVKQENWTASHTHLESKKAEIEAAIAEVNAIKARNKAKIDNARAQGVPVAGASYAGASLGASDGKAGLILSIIALVLAGIYTLVSIFSGNRIFYYDYYGDYYHTGVSMIFSLYFLIFKVLGGLGLGLSIKQRNITGIILGIIALLLLI